MARFGDIVAYSYRADLYCPECIVREYALATQTPMTDLGVDNEGNSYATESNLNSLAADAGIDRNDERTFDSDEFPKVVLFDHLHDQGEKFYCGNCHNELES